MTVNYTSDPAKTGSIIFSPLRLKELIYMVKNTTYPVMLSGKVYEIRYDIMALTAAQTTLKALGFNRGTAWQLADTPYDLGEEVILLQAGLNGAKRLQKDTKLYDLDEIQELVQQHFDTMAEELSELEEAEAMKLFQEKQTELMKSIADAVKGAIGFRYKGKRKE